MSPVSHDERPAVEPSLRPFEAAANWLEAIQPDFGYEWGSFDRGFAYAIRLLRGQGIYSGHSLDARWKLARSILNRPPSEANMRLAKAAIDGASLETLTAMELVGDGAGASA